MSEEHYDNISMWCMLTIGLLLIILIVSISTRFAVGEFEPAVTIQDANCSKVSLNNEELLLCKPRKGE